MICLLMEKRRVEWRPGHYVTAMFARSSSLDRQSGVVLVLAHGAGHSMSSKLISYLHVEMARRGFLTVKFNFPYMEPRFRPLRRADPRNVLVACYHHVLDETIRVTGSAANIYVGGLSLGAAVTSHVVSDEPCRDDVSGLFFLSYPIHYPRHPERVGVQHLRQISRPMLFVAGTKDPWSGPEVLKRVVQEFRG